MAYTIELYKEGDRHTTFRGLLGSPETTSVLLGRRVWKEEAESPKEAMEKAEQYIRERFPGENLMDWTILIS